MKLDCILTSVNNHPLYIDFVPLFIKTWNKLYPNVNVKIILINDNIPENLSQYENNIILFKPIKNVSTAFTSQYIRNLYPALLTQYKNGIMITDIDILPMNRNYYVKNIENFSNDKFVYLRHVCIKEHKQIAMCYNVATSNIWSDIFNIKNIEDINNRLTNVFSNIEHEEGHGKKGWCQDQIDLYKYVFDWNNKTNNFIILHDSNTGYKRLDRNTFDINNIQLQQLIHLGFFSDYHCYRPYNKYKDVNEKIYELL